jgi:hypothetical protein
VHGVGRELIFSIDGHWRRMRVFWSGRDPSLDEAIARYGDVAGTIWMGLRAGPSAHLSLGFPRACSQTVSRAGRAEFLWSRREVNLWLERARALCVR